MTGFRVGIAGATGAVGRELLHCLAESSIEVQALKLLASPRSAGQQIEWQNKTFVVETLNEDNLRDLDLVFFAAGSRIAKELAPKARDLGAMVVDNSSAFRSDTACALVVPELNAEDVIAGPGLIANPNCSTIITLMAVGPLAKAFGLNRIIASTYQAVSGAGAQGLKELKLSQEADRSGESFAPSVFSRPINGNLIPQVGEFVEAGFTDEELKMCSESRKILKINDLRVSCTCVRVGVERAHSISVHVELPKSVTREEILDVWDRQSGLTVHNDDNASDLNPRAVSGSDQTHCGRLRQVDEDGREWAFFVVGDQLLKGAAQNAVEIGEIWAQKTA